VGIFLHSYGHFMPPDQFKGSYPKDQISGTHFALPVAVSQDIGFLIRG
jgi:hypothetical protein